MKPLLVTSGEPAGVGPDICLQSVGLNVPMLVMGDPEMLAARAQLLKKPISIQEYHPGTEIKPEPDTLHVYPIALKAPCVPGELSLRNASYVYTMLETAVQECRAGNFSALVTAPVHKAIINEAGFPFSGHTEFLAAQCEVERVVMMLASDTMRVALATTHLPLSEVAKAITEKALENVIHILHRSLQTDFGITDPVIYLAGLNPHAGENGHLGREEIKIIAPVASKCRKAGIRIVGPLSADTLFSPKNNTECDAYLAMYHDQGLPVIKYASFGQSANITLGLPIVRTSVDHGTALEHAGKGTADSSSMRYAIESAQWMVKNAKPRH